MIQTSWAKRVAMTAAGGLVLCSLGATVGSAAEIRVLTSVALTSAFNELAPNFEQATVNKLNIGYGLIADIRKRMLDGETADVIILSRPVMDERYHRDIACLAIPAEELVSKHATFCGKSIQCWADRVQTCVSI